MAEGLKQQKLNLDFPMDQNFRIVNLARLQRQKAWRKIVNSKKRAINFRQKKGNDNQAIDL